MIFSRTPEQDAPDDVPEFDPQDYCDPDQLENIEGTIRSTAPKNFLCGRSIATIAALSIVLFVL